MAKDTSKLRRKAAEQLRRGAKDKAVALLQEACEKDPYDPENWLAVAAIQLGDGQIGPAGDSLFRATDIFARAGMVREALKVCAETLKVAPTHGPARRMGRFLVSRLPDEEQEAAEATLAGETPAPPPAAAPAPAAPEVTPAPPPPAPAVETVPPPVEPAPESAAPELVAPETAAAVAPADLGAPVPVPAVEVAEPAPPETSEAALEAALEVIPDLGPPAGAEAIGEGGALAALPLPGVDEALSAEGAPESTDVEPTIPRWRADDERTTPWQKPDQDEKEDTLPRWPPTQSPPPRPAGSPRSEEESTKPTWPPRAVLPAPPLEILTLEIEAELPDRSEGALQVWPGLHAAALPTAAGPPGAADSGPLLGVVPAAVGPPGAGDSGPLAGVVPEAAPRLDVVPVSAAPPGVEPAVGGPPLGSGPAAVAGIIEAAAPAPEPPTTGVVSVSVEVGSDRTRTPESAVAAPPAAGSGIPEEVGATWSGPVELVSSAASTRIPTEPALDALSLRDLLGVEGQLEGGAEIPVDVPLALRTEAGDRDRTRVGAAALRSPLLGDLDPALLKRLVDGADLSRRRRGEVVLRQGTYGTALYVILRGEVSVVREQPPPSLVLARLRTGAFFGEMSLVTNFPRSATVVAESDLDLLVIPRRQVSELCVADPSVLRTLLRFCRGRMVATMMAVSPLFQRLDPTARRDLLARFRLREYDAGVDVVKQGLGSGGLHIVMAGRLTVARREAEAGPSVPLATLGPGDVFGEMSLLSGAPAMATIGTDTRSWLLLLPQPAFEELILQQHPDLATYLGTIAERRRRHNEEVVAGKRPYRDGRIETP